LPAVCPGGSARPAHRCSGNCGSTVGGSFIGRSHPATANSSANETHRSGFRDTIHILSQYYSKQVVAETGEDAQAGEPVSLLGPSFRKPERRLKESPALGVPRRPPRALFPPVVAHTRQSVEQVRRPSVGSAGGPAHLVVSGPSAQDAPEPEQRKSLCVAVDISYVTPHHPTHGRIRAC
jgi:hypothetical protein